MRVVSNASPLLCWQNDRDLQESKAGPGFPSGRNGNVCGMSAYVCSKTEVAQWSWVMYHRLLIGHAAWRKHLPSQCSSTATPFRSWMKANTGRTKTTCPINSRRNLVLDVVDSLGKGRSCNFPGPLGFVFQTFSEGFPLEMLTLTFIFVISSCVHAHNDPWTLDAWLHPSGAGPVAHGALSISFIATCWKARCFLSWLCHWGFEEMIYFPCWNRWTVFDVSVVILNISSLR